MAGNLEGYRVAAIYQANRMIVDTAVLGYHRQGDRRKNIDVIRILDEDRDGDIHGLQDSVLDKCHLYHKLHHLPLRP